MKTKIKCLAGSVAQTFKLLPPAFLAAVLLTGCAGNRQQLALASVGPGPINQAVPPLATGSLIVFSACEAVACPSLPYASDSSGSGDATYTWEYTNYKILSPAGKIVKNVDNNEGSTVPRPRQIELPAGNYLVRAQADKYGKVTVPVVIAGGQNTVLDLDYSGYWPRDTRQNTNNAVRFPDGRIIGWLADGQASAKQ